MTQFAYNKQAAFNFGSDARLRGISIMDNPYASTEYASWWVNGWRHANTSWGKDVRGRWRIRTLPHVLRSVRSR